MTSCAQKTLQMKSRDSEVISTSSGNSKGSDYHKGSSFNLRRFFHRRRNRNRSKSRSSLDSDSARSEVSFNITNANATGIAMLPNSNLQVPVFQNLPKELRRREDGSGSLRECPVCLIEQEADQFPEIMTCHHRTCYECLRRYLRIEISESRVAISCPECTEKFHPKDIHMILQDDAMMAKYEEFMLRRVLANDPDARWCPAPDCGYVVIAAGCAGCPKLKCEVPGCDTYFCYHCKLEWHPNQTCDAARAERYPEIRSPSLSYSNETASQRDDVKPCPRCKALLIKINDGSCNHMTCAVCGAEFCWLCMKEISDLHYLSPSGCTFWGKKPWSRKKKIMWQLGTLIGAPLGISLVASIAVPAMVIGIPVWVGRKLHSKYNGRMSKHKRNLVIAGGVLASVFLSPIIAGLAVGIGVPILLAYVYGVVPVSLCRSGGCGVTTNTGGVRFEFDEGNPTGKFQFRAADSQSVDTTHNVANPSIAPSIGDASLGMTNSLSASGSHLDRVGVLRDESDRDSASNRAIAGSSLNGSLCGSVYATAGYQNKLEVQVDVSTVAEEVTKASASGKGDTTPKPLKKERSILQKKLEAADSPPETEFQREGIMSWDVDINDVNALLALFQQDSFEVMSTITEASSIQPTSSSSGASRNLNQPSPMPSLHHTRLFSQSETYGKGLSPSPFLLTSLPESAEQPSPLLSKSCPELGTSDSRVSESSSSVHSDTDLLSTRTDSC